MLIIGMAALGCDSGGSDGSDVAPDVQVMRGLADSGAEPEMGTTDMGNSEVDAMVYPDLGVFSPHCDRSIGYGLRGQLGDVTADGSHSAQAVWTGTEWGVTWIALGPEGDASTVVFQRFNGAGSGIGMPVEIGKTEGSTVRVVATQDGYVIAFLNARSNDDPVSGLRLRVVGPDGRPAFSVVNVEATFDVHDFGFAWAPFAGGMLVYSRGRSGSNGVYSQAVDSSLNVQPAIRLTESQGMATTVSYGDGLWGAAWLAVDNAAPAELAFVLLDDSGGVTEAEQRVSGGGVGRISMAYGQGTFGVAWSRREGGTPPKPVLTLIESGGDIIGTPPIDGPAQFGLAHSVAWIGQVGFAVGWVSTLDGGQTQAGLTRISTLGIPLQPIELPLAESSSHRGVTIAGNQGRLGVWISNDPTPQAAGYSQAARTQFGVVGPCN
jgi:hypothetical protein